MWKSILFFFLLMYFFLSVSSKILSFLRQFQAEAPTKKPDKEGEMKVFVPKKHWKKKNFQGGEYTEFEEIK